MAALTTVLLGFTPAGQSDASSALATGFHAAFAGGRRGGLGRGRALLALRDADARGHHGAEAGALSDAPADRSARRGGARRTATVQRARQISRPGSSVERDLPDLDGATPRTGVAVAVRVPSWSARRWLQLSSMPTTDPSGPTERAAPMLAADSASRADTPPCKMP